MIRACFLAIALFISTDGFAQRYSVTVENLDYLLSYHLPKDTTVRFGFMDRKGKTVIKPEFALASNFMGKYANVVKNGAYGFVDRRGSVTLFPQFAHAYWGRGTLGLARRDEKHYAVINRKGQLLSGYEFDMVSLDDNDLVFVRQKAQWNVMNAQGKLLFDWNAGVTGTEMYNGLVVFRRPGNEKASNAGNYGLMNLHGKVVTPPVYDDILPVDNLFRVRKNRRVGLLTAEGKELIPPEYIALAERFTENLLSAKNEHNWGFIDRKNRLVIPYTYERATNFSEGLAAVVKDKKLGFIDRANKLVIPYRFDDTWQSLFKDGLSVVKVGKKFGYINPEGDLVVAADLDQATPLRNGLGYVEKGGKYGFIDRHGRMVIPWTDRQLWDLQSGRMRFATNTN